MIEKEQTKGQVLIKVLRPLEPKQIRVAYYLAYGLTKVEAAKKVGINPRTIHNWHQNSEFNTAVTIVTRYYADEQAKKEI